MKDNEIRGQHVARYEHRESSTIFGPRDSYSAGHRTKTGT